MKPILLSTLALCLAAGTARASTIYTLTQTPDVTLNSGSATAEEAWDFAVLPGWNQDLTIESVTVTETFSHITNEVLSPANFQSTIIGPYTPTPGTSQNEAYFIFSAKAPTATETVTFSAPYPCCTDSKGAVFSPAQITGGGVLGLFDTRVARNGGSFELDSITIAINTETPEPASLVLMGLGLAGILAAGLRRRTW
jgi:hypothetical protein